MIGLEDLCDVGISVGPLVELPQPRTADDEVVRVPCSGWF